MSGLSRAVPPTLPLAAVAAVLAALTACSDAPTIATDAARAPTPAALDSTPRLATVAPVPGPAVLVGAGDVARCGTDRDLETARLLDAVEGTVFVAGDGAYPDGTLNDYIDCYEPTWGRHKARTRPAVGNNDYSSSGAPGYYAYFGSAAAGDSGRYYYSYDLGDWHVVVLNSEISTAATSEQVQWLRADLAASGKFCTAAIWHRPYVYSYSTGVRPSLKPVWDVLYAFGAELVINGKMRFYERFAPQNPELVADPAGIREFIVGTGGRGFSSFGTVQPNSEVRNTSTAGVLRVTLGATSYSWAFLPVDGKTFTDAGTTSCHGTPAPAASHGGPYAAESIVQFDGSGSRDPQGDPLTYAWSFGDGTTGTGVRPTHTYAADGIYTVSLVVTDSGGNASAPATTTATIRNVPPAVDASVDQIVLLGASTSVSVTFTDPGTDDYPWSYAISWGDGTPDATGSTDTQGATVEETHTYAAAGTYGVTVTVTDREGASGSDGLVMNVRERAAGFVFVGAGDIASCAHTRDESTARILDTIAGTVFTLGDNAYPNGTTSDYACYDASWGRHRSRTMPALGNHEYHTTDAVPSFDYFGSLLGPVGTGYYSFDLGQWHIVVLNDNIAHHAGSTQDQWLQQDLAANPRKCTLAYWHKPYFFSSDQANYTVRYGRKAIWARLYAAGADVVLSGNEHQYERLHPMRPDGTRDDANGIHPFIVGTGGAYTTEPSTAIHPNSVVRGAAYGVMKLTLLDDGYEWEFVPIAGYTFTDRGTRSCH